MKSKLDYIEARLQALVEKSLQLFNRASPQHPLAARLVEAMRQSMLSDAAGHWIVPEVYTILLNPQDHAVFQANEGLLGSLEHALLESASESELLFNSPPVIRMIVDPTIRPGDLQVNATFLNESIGATAAIRMDQADLAQETADPRPNNAFLIVDGDQIFPLRLVVINIGRRMDNHLVIDDPRVSRAHAQLRAIHGHYVIFDLNSSGGTFVNSNRIAQHSLKPGDVIALAGVSLIYGEESPTGPEKPLGDTMDTSTPPKPALAILGLPGAFHGAMLTQ